MQYSYRKSSNSSGFRQAVARRAKKPCLGFATKVRRPAPYILRLHGLTVVLQSRIQLRWDKVWLMFI